MEQANQNRERAFWWRAAEAIPARPLSAASSPSADTAAQTANQPPLGAAPLQPPIAPATGARATPPRRLLDLVAPSRHRIGASGFGGRQMALVAAVAGAFAFAGLTGFGARMRGAPSLMAQIEAWAVAAGFGINEISIAGLKHTSDADVYRALGPPAATLASIDVGAARRRLEALPWVETAALVRVLPDRLRIEVRERQASAVWLQGERKSLVDASGRVLGHLGNFVPPDLPRIAGDGAPEAAAELFAALGRHVGLRSRVVLAQRVGSRRWDLELSSGTRVKLAATDLTANLARLAALLPESTIAESRPNEWGLLDRPGQIVDLTIEGRIVIGAGAAERHSDRQAAAGPDPAQPL